MVSMLTGPRPGSLVGSLTGLTIYPVKSVAARDVARAEVLPWGLAGDRRWAVADPDGTIVTAREEARLLSVTAEIEPDGALLLHGPHAAPLRVPEPRDGDRPTVRIFRDDVPVTDAGTAAADWFTTLLEPRRVRLVWLDDPASRPVDPGYGTSADRVSLADGYPLLLTTDASLGRLNAWIAEEARERREAAPTPLPMRRFRPNVVVGGTVPFAEDIWTAVRIGEVTFRVVKPCGRCVLTTIDHLTLAKSREPLRTLARHRRWGDKVRFGTNLIPDNPGVLRLGDPVEVLATR